MNTREVINDILVNLFKEILELEELALIRGEFSDASVNDMHIIEAIGINETRNMSTIAKSLEITVGSLTTSMNALVRKGYVIRERSETDRRVVMIRLSEKGERAYLHHKDFHDRMTDAAVSSLKEHEEPIVTKVLIGLEKFFRDFRNQTEQENES